MNPRDRLSNGRTAAAAGDYEYERGQRQIFIEEKSKINADLCGALNSTARQ
jgi:hypothetical protein